MEAATFPYYTVALGARAALLGVFADGTPWPLGWVVALAGLGSAACAWFSVPARPVLSTGGLSKRGFPEFSEGISPSLLMSSEARGALLSVLAHFFEQGRFVRHIDHATAQSSRRDGSNAVSSALGAGARAKPEGNLRLYSRLSETMRKSVLAKLYP